MKTKLFGPVFIRVICPILVVAFFAQSIALAADPKTSKEIIQKKKAEVEKARVRSPGPPPVVMPVLHVVVPRKSVHRHIRWALPRDERNDVDYHAVLTRSTRNSGFSLEYYDEPRKRMIESAIVCFKENRRDEGYDHWRRFVASLDTFEKPVDLEPVMYYVLREGCLRQDTNVLFHAERLERTRYDLQTIEEYWDDLFRLRKQCELPGANCLETVNRKIEDEIELLADERELARSRVSVAQRALERAQMTTSGEVTPSVDVFYNVAQELTRRTEIVLFAGTD